MPLTKSNMLLGRVSEGVMGPMPVSEAGLRNREELIEIDAPSRWLAVDRSANLQPCSVQTANGGKVG